MPCRAEPATLDHATWLSTMVFRGLTTPRRPGRGARWSRVTSKAIDHEVVSGGVAADPRPLDHCALSWNRNSGSNLKHNDDRHFRGEQLSVFIRDRSDSE